MKSTILDFKTLSRVHVYRIEYVSYRLLTVSSQPYRWGRMRTFNFQLSSDKKIYITDYVKQAYIVTVPPLL